MKRDYPEKAQRKYYKRASQYTQDQLQEVKTKESIDTPVMVTNYNPANPNIKQIIHRNWNIISNSPDCGTLFKDKPVVGFRRLPNLRDMLTNASMKYPPMALEKQEPKPIIRTRLAKCTYCRLITKMIEVKCNFTHNIHQTRDLPKHITCELSNVIYLISCKKCHKQYVGETSRAFRKRMYEHKASVQKDGQITPVSHHFKSDVHNHKDMKFSVLERCTPKFNASNTARCRRLELSWIVKLHTLTPIGINQFV